MERGMLAAGVTVALLALSPAGASGATLYDQIDQTSPDSTTSQNFESMFDDYDTTAADDFTVPQGETWDLSSGLFRGTQDGVNTTTVVDVTMYADSNGLPGSAVFVDERTATGYPRLDVDLATVPVLQPGKYWIAVQATLNGVSFADPQQWFWAENSDQSGSKAVFENQGNGFSTGCTTFATRSSCLTTHTAPDQSFSLSGTKTDSAPPATKITKKPNSLRLHGKKKTVKATFKFSSSEPGSKFKCKLDSRSKKTCRSPFKAKLKRGRHTLLVTAIDPAGNADPTPAKAKVKVKKAR